jgi:hypothetical protein
LYLTKPNWEEYYLHLRTPWSTFPLQGRSWECGISNKNCAENDLDYLFRPSPSKSPPFCPFKLQGKPNQYGITISILPPNFPFTPPCHRRPRPPSRPTPEQSQSPTTSPPPPRQPSHTPPNAPSSSTCRATPSKYLRRTCLLNPSAGLLIIYASTTTLPFTR